MHLLKENKMRTVLFIGNYTDDVTYDAITKRNIRDLSQASRMFQKRFIDCLADADVDFKVVSLVPTNGQIDLPTLFTDRKINISVVPVKNGSIRSTFDAMKVIKEIVSDINSDSISIVMYAVNPIGLIPLLRLKRKLNLTLTTICPELPNFRRYKKSFTNTMKRRVLDFFNKRFDKYIVFSEAMKKYLPSNRQFMLLEGFAPDTIQKPCIREKNIAMYAGGLAEDNGIKIMIEAARKSKLIDELWICGVGDTLEYVKKNADKKIKYLGRLANDDVVEAEKKAKVLLNVRDPSNELTKFSFPSKVLEYMAAGGMVISTMLPGIPKEYYSFIKTLDEYSAINLASKMDEVFQTDDDQFISATTAASEFITKKQPKSRSKEIVSFIA